MVREGGGQWHRAITEDGQDGGGPCVGDSQLVGPSHQQRTHGRDQQQDQSYAASTLRVARRTVLRPSATGTPPSQVPSLRLLTLYASDSIPPDEPDFCDQLPVRVEVTPKATPQPEVLASALIWIRPHH